MRPLRLIAAAVLLVALAVVVVRASATSVPSPLAAPCTARALVQDLSISPPGRLEVANFGCEGQWGFVWVTTVNTGHDVSATDLVHYDQVSHKWLVASRVTYCHRGLLPDYIYPRGCLSN